MYERRKDFQLIGIFIFSVILAVIGYFNIGPSIIIQRVEDGGLTYSIPTVVGVSFPVIITGVFSLLYWLSYKGHNGYFWGALVGLLLSAFTLAMYVPL